MKKILIAATLLMLIPGFTLAVEIDKPSAADTKKVMDYYNHGKGGGAILVDYTLCTEMGKAEETKNDCAVFFDGNSIEVGQEVYLWMNFMIPVDDTADIFITYTRKNRIRKTQKVRLNSAFRFRTWKKIATEKPGIWTIQIFQELGDKDIDLGKMTYSVKE